MVEEKNDFRGGLNTDDSYYRLPKNCYVDALNVTRDATVDSNDNVITNLTSNRIASYTYPSGTNQTIGAYPNLLRNTVIFFNYNSNSYHGVYEFDGTTRAVSKIFENLTDSGGIDILGFTANDKINNINIYNRDEGDLLFFLDSLGRPTEMNITLFKAGTYTPVTRLIVDTCKAPPLSPPSLAWISDTTRRTNQVRNKLYRFRYFWKYDDNEESVGSPICEVPLPASILDDTYTSVITNNNAINGIYNTGDKNVKEIGILMSFVDKTNNWSDFQLVTLINKADNSYSDNQDFSYFFYNDSTYSTYDVQKSNLLFDYVPNKALAQGMPNGNYLAFFGITEGYDRGLLINVVNTVNTAAASSSSFAGDLNGIVTYGGNNPILGGELYITTFSGIPSTGTIINLYARLRSSGVQFIFNTYTTISGDTGNSVASALGGHSVSSGITFISVSGTAVSYRFNTTTYEPISSVDAYMYVEIVPPTLSLGTNSIATWKWSTERDIAIQYFDEHGKTNGVLYNAKISFPAYAENASHVPLIPYINTKIYHVPPVWAYSYTILFSKEPTDYLFWHTVGVNTSESSYIYFDITNMALNATKTPTVAEVLSWTFQDGDRMRLIRRMSDNTVFADTYDSAIEGIITDPIIGGITQTDKTFIKIKKVAPFSTVDFSSNYFVIELYRPGQQQASGTNKTFYECGRQYPILNPTTSTRVHGGQITSQSTNYLIPAELEFYKGDSYFRGRTVYLSQTGFGSFYVQDRNFVDFYISAVSSIDGRPSVIDVNAREAKYGATIRYSLAYQPNTNINGLNKFYEENLEDCDASFGDILRVAVRDRYIRIFQQLKIGMLPIFNQISKDTAGNDVQVITTKLLNPVQYYVGNFGIGDSPESLASFNYADYFCDTNKGAVCRVSDNGVTPISVLYKMNSWANRNIPLRTGSYKIYGAFDQKRNNYIISLEATPTSSAQTLTFNEGSRQAVNDVNNSFESFISLYPEMMTTLGTLLIAFKDGQVYTHDGTTYNNFFGVQYDSYIVPVFNQNSFFVKTAVSIEQLASLVWPCPEITTNIMSYGTTPQQSSLIAGDFEQLEGKWCSSFFRDNNSQGGLINGDTLKYNWMSIKFRVQNQNDLITLNIISVKSIDSPHNPQP